MNDKTHLRVRRGTKDIMNNTTKSSIILEEGEIFVECPNSGVGKGKCKIKIGDGVTAYSALPYALGNVAEDEPIDFLEDRRNNIQELIDEIAAGIIVKKCIAIMKRTLQLLLNKFDEYYTKNEADNIISRIDLALDDRYTKLEINDIVERIDGDISDVDAKFDLYYTADQIDQLIGDYYTKNEINDMIEIINNTFTNYYTKQETKDLVLIDVRSSDPASPEVGEQWILNN